MSCGGGYEVFCNGGKEYIQYDYRTSLGILFSCKAPNLRRAREKRNFYFKYSKKFIYMVKMY